MTRFFVRHQGWPVLGIAAIFVGCATTGEMGGGSSAQLSNALLVSGGHQKAGLRVFFRDGNAFASEGGRQWRIAEVGRNELLWAPEGVRFAYLLAQDKRRDGRQIYHIVIRNIRGDSVNEFPVYRPGRPSQLEWLGEDRLSYLAPKHPSGDAYVIHDVASSEVLRVYRGRQFRWSPGHERLAYVVRRGRCDQVLVDEQVVWPSRAKRHRQILGELVWDPRGEALTFIEKAGRSTRLVVLLDLTDPAAQLTWPLPAAAARGEHKLFWAENRVVVGQSLLKPRYAASWTSHTE